ncbi:MAG: hypothetical protein AAFO74_10130 [Pseudomonadota bacterium]
MKIWVSLAAIGILSGCVSTASNDRERAYSQCSGISDKASRNVCLADAIQDAERDRLEQAARQAQQDENAERRELGREIAGAEKDD